MINAFLKRNQSFTEEGETLPDARSRSAIWFKFKEGSMNAVRRTLKISDLL
uniref:Uncharacterized protein n=1 Tax=Romanomermis culicivorax TaxID=13658 RepID=A0A915IN11_ROMCU